MKQSLLAFAIAMFATACSEPQCAPSEIKVGMSCRQRRRDAGIEDQEMATVRGDASVPSGQTNDGDAGLPYARVDADVRTSVDQEQPDVGSADASSETASGNQVDAGSVPSPLPAPSCGDGILNGTELCDPMIPAAQAGACKVASDCKSDNACIAVTLAGASKDCNARCETATTVKCSSDDGCCPDGCNKSNDNDCSASCKNGYVDEGETCEPGVGSGCPKKADCVAPNACTTATFTGSSENCNAACTLIAVANLKNDDGTCCPGAGPTTDNDCLGCGNGKVEAGETCDQNCKSICTDSDPCTSDAPVSGNALSCNVTCPATLPTISPKSGDGLCCTGATPTGDHDCAGCGNQKVEGSEQCDDGNLINGDLCDQNCKRENDPQTPGDDRAGFYTCGPTLTCTAPQSCNESLVMNPITGINDRVYSCTGLTNYFSYNCDGPEDCAAGERCTDPDDDAFAVCTTLTSDIKIFCHVNAHCINNATCSKDPSSGVGKCPAVDFIP